MSKTTAKTSCIILGSGRSGTSLMAGSIVKNYDFTGDFPFAIESNSNPTGFFEDKNINHLNDLILEDNGLELPAISVKTKVRHGGWLIKAPVIRNWKISQRNIKPVMNLTDHENYCFKDPRFSYTFPLWRELSKEPVKFLVVFREPNVTARSMLKEKLVQELGLDFEDCLGIWKAMYKNILIHASDDTFFIHYEQIFQGNVGKLEDFLQIKVDKSFVKKDLKRTTATGISTGQYLYKQLCDLADYQDPDYA